MEDLSLFVHTLLTHSSFSLFFYTRSSDRFKSPSVPKIPLFIHILALCMDCPLCCSPAPFPTEASFSLQGPSPTHHRCHLLGISPRMGQQPVCFLWTQHFLPCVVTLAVHFPWVSKPSVCQDCVLLRPVYPKPKAIRGWNVYPIIFS